MKTKLFIFSILTSLVLIACEPSPQPATYTGYPEPTMYIVLVKFTEPQYVDSVVVEENAAGDSCQIRKMGGFGTCTELCVGHSPYIPLPNEYYLVDWKWGYFFYMPYTFVINVNWLDVIDTKQKWECPKGQLNISFIKDLRCCYFKSIDEYSGESYGYRNYEIPSSLSKYHSLSDVPYDQLEYFLKQVAVQDSLQEVYKERISKIIEEGALDDLYKSYR